MLNPYCPLQQEVYQIGCGASLQTLRGPPAHDGRSASLPHGWGRETPVSRSATRPPAQDGRSGRLQPWRAVPSAVWDMQTTRPPTTGAVGVCPRWVSGNGADRPVCRSCKGATKQRYELQKCNAPNLLFTEELVNCRCSFAMMLRGSCKYATTGGRVDRWGECGQHRDRYLRPPRNRRWRLSLRHRVTGWMPNSRAAAARS